MTNIAVTVERVSKKYSIGTGKSADLRGTICNFFTHLNLFSTPKTGSEDFWALKDITFEVKKGESVGIIGKNGAGKSTLLKLLSRITKPTTGRIEIMGRVSSLLEVGTGFHPELTGRENILLNGTILGMKRREIKTKFDEIISFSGVEKFIDTPVKHYSSGMKVRLAFSVAAHLEPEILIVDEVLAVGDAEFQKKCLGKMEEVTGEGRTVLFVSHNMGAVKNICKTGILIEGGKIYDVDTIGDVVKKYLDLNFYGKKYHEEDLPENDKIKFHSIVITQNGKVRREFDNGDEIKIKMSYQVRVTMVGLRIYFDLVDENDDIVIRSFHDEHYKTTIPKLEVGEYVSTAIIPKNLLVPKKYNLVVRASIYNVGPILDSDILIPISVNLNSVISSYPNDKIRSKVLPFIKWENIKK